MTENTTPSQGANPFALPEPNWDHWQAVKTAPLWCAVALACNLDPDQFRIGDERLPKGIRPYPSHMADLLAMAKGNVGANGVLRPVRRRRSALPTSPLGWHRFTTRCLPRFLGRPRNRTSRNWTGHGADTAPTCYANLPKQPTGSGRTMTLLIPARHRRIRRSLSGCGIAVIPSGTLKQSLPSCGPTVCEQVHDSSS